MIILKATTESLQIVTTTTANIDYSISYADITTTAFTPSTNEGKIITGTTTAALAAPAASTQRQVKLITISNIHASASNIITVQKLITATTYNLTPKITLLAGETVQYMDGQGWIYYSVTGAIKGNQTAAGSDTEVQFNDAGAVNGDPGLTFSKTTDTLALSNTGSTIDIGVGTLGSTPSAPSAGVVTVFGRTVAGRAMIAQIGPSGLDSALQPFLARNKVGYWDPQGNSATVPGVFGITALTAQGTATSRTVATTSLATRMRRIGYPTSAATAGLFLGARMAVAQFSCGSGSPDGSGFMLVERWVESDPAPVAARRIFTGMTAATTALTNVEYNTLTNVVGVIQLSTDATQWYSYAAGSSAQTAVALGTSLGAPGGNSTTAWELAIFAPNGVANTYYCQMTNLTTSAVVNWTVTGAATVCPQSTTLLAWNHGGTNNTTALATGMDLCSLYIETDT